MLRPMSVRPDTEQKDMSVEMDTFSAQIAVARAAWRAYKEWVEADVLPEPLSTAVSECGEVDLKCPPEMLS